MSIEPLLTTKDLQVRYGVSATTIWKWRRAGLLCCVALPGNKVRFDRAELARFEGTLVPRTEPELPAGALLLSSSRVS